MPLGNFILLTKLPCALVQPYANKMHGLQGEMEIKIIAWADFHH